MKKIIIGVLLLIIIQVTHAQDDANKKDNYTIQRLIVTNDNGEILIYKGKNYWMPPALRHNKNESITEGLENLAQSYGLTITRPELAGLFTYKFGFKQGVSFRSFYTAKVTGTDDISLPPPITQAKWVTQSEIMKVIGGMEVRKKMLKQVLEKPNTLWGGSFYLYNDKNGERKSRVLESIYPLR